MAGNPVSISGLKLTNAEKMDFEMSFHEELL